MLKKIIFAFLPFLFIWTACEHTTELIETQGSIRGTVWCLLPGGAVTVHPAYIFSGDTLVTTTDPQGQYRIDALEIGEYEFTCSALFCGDTILPVHVQLNRTVTLDFNLKPDSSTGLVIGEFQDGYLFAQCVQDCTELAEWSEKQIYDAATGATLQSKTLEYLVPDRFVSVGDTSLTTADYWGQYGCYIPCGTYPLTGSCEGYENIMRVVNIQPDSRNYINFILPRQVVAIARSKQDRN
jgi:hypothetical protein